MLDTQNANGFHEDLVRRVGPQVRFSSLAWTVPPPVRRKNPSTKIRAHIVGCCMYYKFVTSIMQTVSGLRSTPTDANVVERLSMTLMNVDGLDSLVTNFTGKKFELGDLDAANVSCEVNVIGRSCPASTTSSRRLPISLLQMTLRTSSANWVSPECGNTKLLTTAAQPPSCLFIHGADPVQVLGREGCHEWLGCMLSTATSDPVKADLDFQLHLDFQLQNASQAFWKHKWVWYRKRVLCDTDVSLVHCLAYFNQWYHL